ncbi:MAG: hypothetical protein AAF664_09355 [Planctomycetota bacterium]
MKHQNVRTATHLRLALGLTTVIQIAFCGLTVAQNAIWLTQPARPANAPHLLLRPPAPPKTPHGFPHGGNVSSFQPSNVTENQQLASPVHGGEQMEMMGPESLKLEDGHFQSAHGLDSSQHAPLWESGRASSPPLHPNAPKVSDWMSKIHAPVLPPKANIPEASSRTVWKSPYAYGYFGSTKKGRWNQHHGYRDRYTEFRLK